MIANTTNSDIRALIYRNGLRHWEVAEKIGISNSTLSVWLRKELPDDKRKRVEQAIKELSESR